MFSFRCELWFLGHFFVATPLTLPNWEDSARVGGVLVNRTIRGNYLAPATGTDTTTGGSPFYINR